MRVTGAVSYTHLDVYKRQLLPRALAQLTEELDAADGPAAPRKEEKDMDHLSLAAELAVNLSLIHI